MKTDVVIVGAGLAGLVAACELVERGKRVTIVDQEGEQSLGGQAFWSFGGLFLVDSPEQRRMGVHDARGLALRDWLGSAGFDRDDDEWPRKWAEAYVNFAAGEKRAWLRARGIRFFPIVGWAERRWNSVPRFHVTWGTGPALVEAFAGPLREAASRGQVTWRFRHRVKELVTRAGAVTGVRGDILERTDTARGVETSRRVVGDFAIDADSVIVTSGGIGGNHDLVRQHWPSRMGSPPPHLLSGVPAHVDGGMLGVCRETGARVINADRMWHYTEGIENYAPIWPLHGIRILPGPSSFWFDAHGRRLPAPLFPGFDTLGTLEHIMHTGFDHTWFVLNERIIAREFALSGSEQNPDLTGKSVLGVLSRIGKGAPPPVRAFVEKGRDFIVRDTLPDLVHAMNDLTGADLLDAVSMRREIEGRDAELASAVGSDAQIAAIRNARRYLGDRLIRVAKPHRLLDAAAGPLIAVRLRVLTRKTLGGVATNLSGQVLDERGQSIPGLFAAGEVAGFGGGGMHGYRALEGTFLGGCIFSGRSAGRSAG